MPEFEANDNPSLRRLQARLGVNSKRLDSAASYENAGCGFAKTKSF
jgi:hypothetical protein